MAKKNTSKVLSQEAQIKEEGSERAELRKLVSDLKVLEQKATEYIYGENLKSDTINYFGVYSLYLGNIDKINNKRSKPKLDKAIACVLLSIIKGAVLFYHRGNSFFTKLFCPEIDIDISYYLVFSLRSVVRLHRSNYPELFQMVEKNTTDIERYVLFDERLKGVIR